MLETIIRTTKTICLTATTALMLSFSPPPVPEEKEHIYVPPGVNVEPQKELKRQQLFLRSLGIPPKPVPDDCGLKHVGIIGASNTVGRSYIRFLRELCPSTEFIVHARGGYTPQEQLNYLLPELLNQNIEHLIIDPSGNGVEKAGYIAAVREMVKEAKQNGIETTVLSISPRQYHVPEWKAFNSYLLKQKLDVPQLIDHVVDITSLLLRKDSSYYCGYCVRDGVHWTDKGDERVAVQIYNTLWAKKKLLLPE